MQRKLDPLILKALMHADLNCISVISDQSSADTKWRPDTLAPKTNGNKKAHADRRFEYIIHTPP